MTSAVTGAAIAAVGLAAAFLPSMTLHDQRTAATGTSLTLVGVLVVVLAAISRELWTLVAASVVGCLAFAALCISSLGLSRVVATSSSSDLRFAVVIRSHFQLMDDATYSVVVYRNGRVFDDVLARYCQSAGGDGTPEIRWIGARKVVMSFPGREITLRVFRDRVRVLDGSLDGCRTRYDPASQR